MGSSEFSEKLVEYVKHNKRLPDCTVVRCTQTVAQNRAFTYVFLYVADLDEWYSTAASGYVPKRMSHVDFMHFVKHDSVSKVQIAESWVSL